ncbi:hypothetical protein, partial [Alistipes putredinis]|uniref:hypothetical protein n=1 Tax=Alistipes putredinis TaxID=28117 RepID=UPI003AAF7452
IKVIFTDLVRLLSANTQSRIKRALNSSTWRTIRADNRVKDGKFLIINLFSHRQAMPGTKI